MIRPEEMDSFVRYIDEPLPWMLKMSLLFSRQLIKNFLDFPYLSTDPQSTINFRFSLPMTIIFATAILFSFVMSVIGNSLVICIIAKQQYMKTSTNCLIMNLAVCDILTTLLLTPTFTRRIFLGGRWFGGDIGRVTCKIVEYGNSFPIYCSLLNLVAIAIDRCLAITRPLSYKLSSKWLVKISIPVIWLISLSLPVVSLSDTQL